MNPDEFESGDEKNDEKKMDNNENGYVKNQNQIIAQKYYYLMKYIIHHVLKK